MGNGGAGAFQFAAALDGFSPHVVFVGIHHAATYLVTRLEAVVAIDEHAAVDFRGIEEAAANRTLLFHFIDQHVDFLADAQLQAGGADGLLVGHEAVPAVPA